MTPLDEERVEKVARAIEAPFLPHGYELKPHLLKTAARAAITVLDRSIPEEPRACPTCEGRGVYDSHPIPPETGPAVEFECYTCNGTGRTPSPAVGGQADVQPSRIDPRYEAPESITSAHSDACLENPTEDPDCPRCADLRLYRKTLDDRRSIVRDILYRRLPTGIHADICREIADDFLALDSEQTKLDADSGMSGDAVAQAEAVWANLPTRNLSWTSLDTHEKALVCHTIARLTGEQTKLIGELREAGKALLIKLDEAKPHIDNAIVIATMHHSPYAGPNYGVELDAFREVLTKASAMRGVEGGG